MSRFPFRSAVLAAATLLAAFSASAADEQRLVRAAVDTARELRGSENVYDQLTGAGILVEIGDKDALQFLADNLGHPEWSMMRSAIDTLLNVQHPAGLDVLYRYADMTDSKVFMKFLAESCALHPRADMGEFLMKSLRLDDVWVKKHALQALAQTPVDDKEARLRAVAEDTKQDSVSRAYAYYALMGTAARDESLEKLIEISHEWGPEAQEAAAVGLGMVENDQTKAALDELRHARTYKVKLAATVSEAGFGMDDAMEALVHTIAYGKGLDPAVAAASLHRLPPPIAVRITHTLIACCELDSDVGTRLVEAWAGIDADPTPVYDWALSNDNADIRMQAIWLVGERMDREYLERLGSMLEDTDSGVRGMAAWAIVRMLGDEYEPGVET